MTGMYWWTKIPFIALCSWTRAVQHKNGILGSDLKQSETFWHYTELFGEFREIYHTAKYIAQRAYSQRVSDVINYTKNCRGHRASSAVPHPANFERLRSATVGKIRMDLISCNLTTEHSGVVCSNHRQPLPTQSSLHSSAVTQIKMADPFLQAVLLSNHTHAYATFIEAGMVATHSAQSHSTNNRLNQLPRSICKVLEQLHITQSPRTVTASPQSTISWSQDQSTSHCNLATQLQCSHATGHIDSSNVTNISSCRITQAMLQLF